MQCQWIKPLETFFLFLIQEVSLVGILPAVSSSLPVAILTCKPAVTHNTIQIQLQIHHKYCCKYNSKTVVILTRAPAVTRIHDENFVQRWANNLRELAQYLSQTTGGGFWGISQTIIAALMFLQCEFYASWIIFCQIVKPWKKLAKL